MRGTYFRILADNCADDPLYIFKKGYLPRAGGVHGKDKG